MFVMSVHGCIHSVSLKQLSAPMLWHGPESLPRPIHIFVNKFQLFWSMTSLEHDFSMLKEQGGFRIKSGMTGTGWNDGNWLE